MRKDGSSNPRPSLLEGGSLDSDSIESNIVDWSGPDDVQDPHSWASSRRWTQIILVSLFALVT